MAAKNPISAAAAAMGRVKSARKATAARENGKKGGRPRKADKKPKYICECGTFDARVKIGANTLKELDDKIRHERAITKTLSRPQCAFFYTAHRTSDYKLVREGGFAP